MSPPQLPLRAIIGAIPATIVVVVGALIILLALFLPEDRQDYALRAWGGVVDLVSVLVGMQAKTSRDDV
jgi:hypothetical protein